jgi:hypothetical protein
MNPSECRPAISFPPFGSRVVASSAGTRTSMIWRLAVSRIGVSSTREQGRRLGYKSERPEPVELSDFQRDCTEDVRRRSDHAKA